MVLVTEQMTDGFGGGLGAQTRQRTQHFGHDGRGLFGFEALDEAQRDAVVLDLAEDLGHRVTHTRIRTAERGDQDLDDARLTSRHELFACTDVAVSDAFEQRVENAEPLERHGGALAYFVVVVFERHEQGLGRLFAEVLQRLDDTHTHPPLAVLERVDQVM